MIDYNCNNKFIIKIIKDQEDLLQVIDKNGITKEHLGIKIQVFASKYGLNNCKEDMNEIAKKGCIFVGLSEQQDYLYKKDEDGEFLRDSKGNLIPDFYTDLIFQVEIIPKENKQEYRKRDFSFHKKTAHLFFEIPIVNYFTEEQHKKWLNYCCRELSKLIEVNHKRRDSWLKKKKLEQDFIRIS